MSLSLDDVRRIAHLARIEIDDAQARATLAQLNDIFAMIETMQKVATDGVEPMAHPLGGSQRLRDDVVTEGDDRENNMRNAPAQADGLFLVPKVIE
ncbi:MAG TPA: Asp-tRNA(Asn)/Glu-tRNA(Gln) amidotransferase subunit GatC [Burkholderiaceae bacterium]|jgi:aspartyl-tRNA(Asn)/glutamyl-tRNA(Gln) amidotransferase subunit C|nr:Asp-tRNA(Asn)/Glu-tRNA(Gln) amidotransferase subunit GatC [Burkholderiaceae bacterium]